LVRHVRQVLGRGHTLFGEAGSSGGTAPWDARWGLAGARDRLRRTRQQMAGVTGVLPVHYAGFAHDAARALDAATGTDTRLRAGVRDAGRSDHAGWASSAAAVHGAATDTTRLAPVLGTPAGQRALIAALRARLIEQQRVINACKARDARLAAALRSLAYGGPRAYRSGAIPLRAESFGAAPAGGRPSGRGGGGGLGGSLSPRPMPARGVNPATSAAAGLSAASRAVGTPLGALTPDSGPREVAAAIIHEAHRRGYSPYQTTAILADALQESDLSPRAVSPNRLWVSIFQQDASYPGRHNPNLAIAEFFNRLERHGGPSRPDIWKSIFWLQQRPGEASADAAYAHGRQAYLREIQGQHQRAVAMYRAIVG
jgi:hypothetical protein